MFQGETLNVHVTLYMPMMVEFRFFGGMLHMGCSIISSVSDWVTDSHIIQSQKKIAHPTVYQHLSQLSVDIQLNGLIKCRENSGVQMKRLQPSELIASESVPPGWHNPHAEG